MKPDSAWQTVVRVVDVALECRHAEAHYGATLYLGRQTLWVNHRSAVDHAHVVYDLELARLYIELDLDEPNGESRNRPVALEVVLGHADQSRTRQTLDRSLGHPVEIVRHLVPTELPAELDRPARSGRIGESSRGVPPREHGLVADVVIVRRAPEVHGRYFFEFAQGVHRGDVIRTGHRKRRVAAELSVVPRQAATRVATVELTVLPLVLEHLSRHTRRARIGIRPEVSDARVNVERPVGRDPDQPVEAARAG